MNIHSRQIGTVAAVALAMSGFAIPALAQDIQGQESGGQESGRQASGQASTPASSAAEPVCMSAQFKDVPQVARGRRGQAFRIVVAKDDAQALAAKGYEATECTTADLASSERRGAWRDEICALAAYGNEAVQNQLERAYGERPAVLCGSAQRVAGPWQRGKGEGGNRGRGRDNAQSRQD